MREGNWRGLHENIFTLDVIYHTRERVFHQDIQTPRGGLKKPGAAEFLTDFFNRLPTLSSFDMAPQTKFKAKVCKLYAN